MNAVKEPGLLDAEEDQILSLVILVATIRLCLFPGVNPQEKQYNQRAYRYSRICNADGDLHGWGHDGKVLERQTGTIDDQDNIERNHDDLAQQIESKLCLLSKPGRYHV